MLHAHGDLPISFCVKCGGWTSRRSHRLAKGCGPPTAAGTMALKRIEAGLHPWQARDASTGKKPPEDQGYNEANNTICGNTERGKTRREAVQHVEKNRPGGRRRWTCQEDANGNGQPEQ